MPNYKGCSIIVSEAVAATIRVIKGTLVNHNPAIITSPNFNDQTLSVPGVALGDFVLVQPKTSVPAGGLIWAFVSAADTVTFRFYGINAALTVDFAAQDFNVLVLKV